MLYFLFFLIGLNLGGVIHILFSDLLGYKYYYNTADTDRLWLKLKFRIKAA